MLLSETVERFLRLRLPPGARLLVAVSGGSDSVALLHALRGSSYKVTVGHVDHALRPSSRSDARFVRSLAHAWDIPCRVLRRPVRPALKTRGMGLEDAARAVRYDTLRAMARQVHAQAVLTAHTRDDQAETVLLNIFRGAGPLGMAGMPEDRVFQGGKPLRLMRPLLGVTKAELSDYRRQHQLPCRQDSTNRAMRFTRNRIRHRVLPELERMFPGVSGRLAQTARILRDEEAVWDFKIDALLRKFAHQTGSGWTVVLTGLFGYHKALIRRIFRRLLPGATFQDIEQVLLLARSPEASGVLELPGGWRIKRNRSGLSALHKRNR